MRWLERLARKRVEIDRAPDQASDIAAQMAEAFEAARSGDYARALAIWGPLAQAGVARAQNNVGACFAEGLGVERDPALALRWLTLAAEAGDPVGQRNLAALYFKGEGVEQDYARAAELYRLAAEQGDGPAQDMLSWMLLEGECVPADAAEARRWALAAAEQGVAASMTRLGMIYHNALGVERDPAVAAAWWQKPRCAAMPTARRCSAPPASSAQAWRKTASRRSPGCCGRRRAAARLPRRSLRAHGKGSPRRRSPKRSAAPPRPWRCAPSRKWRFAASAECAP